MKLTTYILTLVVDKTFSTSLQLFGLIQKPLPNVMVQKTVAQLTCY